MGIIGWIILGALAGWITSIIAGTNRQQDWLMNIVLGIAGALVGGFAWSLITDGKVDYGLNVGSLILAVVGGLILSWVAGMFTGSRA